MKLKKFIVGFVAVVVVIVLFWLMGGSELLCKIGFGDKKKEADRVDIENQADGEDSTEAPKEEDIRYVTKPRNENLKSEAVYNGMSTAKLAWWFKRDANHGPSDCDHTLDIGKYGAYYLDTRYAGNTDEQSEKVIYLTMDCGYDNGLTEGMVDVLTRCEVPCCFFVTQTYIRDNIDLVKKMKQNGFQVGNHTISHPELYNMSYEDIKRELDGCYNYMKEATGYDMDPYFRPPCGEYSERVLALAQDLGYKTIFWSMAYYDYDVNKQPGTDYVIEHFNKYHHNGAIILMHNVSTSNAEALETVINNLKAAGYRFASLNELE